MRVKRVALTVRRETRRKSATKSMQVTLDLSLTRGWRRRFPAAAARLEFNPRYIRENGFNFTRAREKRGERRCYEAAVIGVRWLKSDAN